MPNLCARFTVDVSAPCLIAWPEQARPEFTVQFEDFQVTVCLLPAQHWKTQSQGDAYWTTSVAAMEVLVCRDEAESPPAVITTATGRDLSAQGAYLSTKLPQYQAAALEVSNRVLRFFQYSLGTPLVQPISRWNHALNNPTWLDASGAKLGGFYAVVAQSIPGVEGKLSAKKLTPNELSALREYVTTPHEPSLAETLLSDGQTAWFEGKLRRTILELAICTEVMVKRRFFAQASPAGAAFDYLEDKAKVSVRVLELLDAVAEEAFARSYRKEEPGNYESIDHLFRCRNKIAHRGELSFRDDSGKRVSVEAPLVATWWQAVSDLKTWLDALV